MGVICECACDVCGELYVGETERSLEERVEEHEKSIEDSTLGPLWANTKNSQNIDATSSIAFIQVKTLKV